MSLPKEEVARRAAAIAKAAMAARKAAVTGSRPPADDVASEPEIDSQSLQNNGLQQILDGVIDLSRSSRGVLVVWEQRSRIAAAVTWPATMEAGPVVEGSRSWGERARQGPLLGQEPDGRHLYCAPLRTPSGEAGYLYLERPLTAGPFGPWEQQAGLSAANAAAALVSVVRSYGDLAGGYQRLQVINKLIRTLSSNLPMKAVYEEVLRACLNVSGAEMGGFFVGDSLRMVATMDLHGSAVPHFEPSKTLMEQARKLRRPQSLVDASENPTLMANKSIMVKGIRSVVLVPLAVGDKLVGLVYLTSQVAQRTFGKEDETILEALATQTATALERAMLYQELEIRVTERTKQLAKANEELKTLNEALDLKVQSQVQALRQSEKLHRYLAPNVVEAVMRSDGENSIGQTSRKKLTIFFSDIRGFTTFAEANEPEEVISLLNEYVNHMTALIHRHEGTLNKFLGDGIMGFFGDPIPMADHAQRAVRMAMEMQEFMKSLQARWFSQGQTPLQIGVGINTGFVTVGNIGSEIFTDYTVIGTQVNLTSRIQSLAGPGEVVISHSTYAQVKDIVEVEPRGEVTVKGLHTPVLVYRVIRMLADHERVNG